MFLIGEIASEVRYDAGHRAEHSPDLVDSRCFGDRAWMWSFPDSAAATTDGKHNTNSNTNTPNASARTRTRFDDLPGVRHRYRR
jgi:hypothetical protein